MPKDSAKISTHLICGFLGAGKTTAIAAHLANLPNERIAIVVNDFGEAALDEMTLRNNEPFQIRNIPGGCVCCTAPEGFIDALAAVLEEKPDRLVIEPTGLARPQDLIDTIQRSPHREQLEMAPVVVIVDPKQLRLQEHTEQTLIREQAEVADVLVANRTDLCDSTDLAHFDDFAEKLWPGPLSVHKTKLGILPITAFEWPAGEGPRASRKQIDLTRKSKHDHSSTEGFAARSWKWPADTIFSHPRLTECLRRATRRESEIKLERFKGIFRTQEGVSHLEVSGKELHERSTSYRRDSRADAIVPAENEIDLDTLQEWLEVARLQPEEMNLPADRIHIAPIIGDSYFVGRDRLRSLPGLTDVSERFPNRQGQATLIDALWSELNLTDEGEAVVVASDGFASEPIPITSLRQGFLLHSIEDEGLPNNLGGPFRLLIPEGTEAVPSSCANVKGVVKIVLRP